MAALALGCALGLGGAGCSEVPVDAGQTPAPPGPPAQRSIAAVGRLRPKDGVVRVAAPSHSEAVVWKLNVAEGDRVEAGQVIAVLDHSVAAEAMVEQLEVSAAAKQAAVEGLEAELSTTRSEQRRIQKLYDGGFVSESDKERAASRLLVDEAAVRRARLELAATRAELRRARIDLANTLVRSPLRGQVLKIHARPGEKVGDDGVAELAMTDAMYVIAEVYETDIAGIRVGQRATARSPALRGELTGTVERIGRKIGKQDVLGTDPAAKMDARVVEVEIRLDDSAAVSGLTNLEVEVRIAI
ncbi:MAG TPA: efflux RND transporter periplasmic adaptor subunit [Vicinamibacteria bacterium]|jgi:HlyD family secretion protein